jgi:hypothetical protein
MTYSDSSRLKDRLARSRQLTPDNKILVDRFLIAFLALTLALTIIESGVSRMQAVNHRITQLEDHIQW